MGEKKKEHYDVVIIGGGPAGLAAAIYCGRAHLDTLLLEKTMMGGLATNTNTIENYPGFPEGITGPELTELFHRQARKFGIKFKMTDVKDVEFRCDSRRIETFRTVYDARVVIIATGGRPRVTRAQNEEKFLYNRGISFCATCDAAASEGKTVMVIGSGDSAIEEGTYLTRFAREVIVSVIHDEPQMDCNETARDAALANPKMSFAWNTIVDSFEGGETLERVNLKNLKSGEVTPYEVDTCFEFIGYEPNTELFLGKVEMSRRNYIITNEAMETGIPGVFACGDVREKNLRQVVTAVSDGAVAGVGAEKYIAESTRFERDILQKEKIGLIYIYSAIDAPSQELLPIMREVESAYGGQVKLSVIDQYRNHSLCEQLGCDVEPMTVFYTVDGEIVETRARCDRKSIIAQLNKLVDDPVDVVESFR